MQSHSPHEREARIILNIGAVDSQYSRGRWKGAMMQAVHGGKFDNLSVLRRMLNSTVRSVHPQ